MTYVCLIGLGRTGMEIARAIMEQRDIELVGAICSEFSGKIGRDMGEILGLPDTGARVYAPNQIGQVIEELKPDIFVDFSNPKATLNYMKTISKHGLGHVIGTTGFSKTDIMRMRVLAEKNNSAILYAPNVTLGINVMMLLANITARILKDYDFEITEAHHKYKKDAPSGTALKIADEIGKGLEASGIEADESIPIHAIRAGGIVGRHQLIVAGENDKLEIIHESFSRKAFAEGALTGIRFIKDKKGFFEMRDVLELEKVLSSYFEKRKIMLYGEG